MRKTYLVLGAFNAICDVCGFKFKSYELQKRWDGAMTCETDWEMRNPQDFLRIPEEKVSPPWARPEGEDQFVNVTFTPPT